MEWPGRGNKDILWARIDSSLYRIRVRKVALWDTAHPSLGLGGGILAADTHRSPCQIRFQHK